MCVSASAGNLEREKCHTRDKVPEESRGPNTGHHQSLTQLKITGRDLGRVRRYVQTVPLHRPFAEDQQRDEERETLRQAPIVPEKKKDSVEETHTECQSEIEGSHVEIEEEEGAVGGSLKPIIPIDQWDDIASLVGRREPKINPNVEIVMPYRWLLQRKKGECREDFHSRLAEEDLERFLRQTDKPTSSKLEDLRYKQRQALRERSGGVSRKEDIESRDPTPQRPRSHTPPGPPNPPMETGAVRKELPEKPRREEPTRPLKVKTRRVMFGGLRIIPTDVDLDPPPYSCFNCWQRGHEANYCPSKIKRLHCLNCGRRRVSVHNCPRCGEQSKRYV